MGAGEKQDTARLGPPAEDVSTSHARHMDWTPRQMCKLVAEEITTGCGNILVADLTMSHRSAMGRAEMMGIHCEGIGRLSPGNDAWALVAPYGYEEGYGDAAIVGDTGGDPCVVA